MSGTGDTTPWIAPSNGEETVLDGPFFLAVNSFLGKHATEVRLYKGGVKAYLVPLYQNGEPSCKLHVYEEDWSKGRGVQFCDQCRVMGWQNHPVSRRRYHFILPSHEARGDMQSVFGMVENGTDEMRLTWAPVKPSVGVADGTDGAEDPSAGGAAESMFESKLHYLHGVVHANGFGHLLRMNGTEGGSRQLVGAQLMGLWDRITTTLRVRAVSVEDVSNKSGMLLRVLYSAAHGTTWYGKWGYHFGRGCYGTTEPHWKEAVDYVNSASLDALELDFQGSDPQTVKIIQHYREAEPRLMTLSELFQRMLAYVNKPQACVDLVKGLNHVAEGEQAGSNGLWRTSSGPGLMRRRSDDGLGVCAECSRSVGCDGVWDGYDLGVKSVLRSLGDIPQGQWLSMADFEFHVRKHISPRDLSALNRLVNRISTCSHRAGGPSAEHTVIHQTMLQLPGRLSEEHFLACACSKEQVFFCVYCKELPPLPPVTSVRPYRLPAQVHHCSQCLKPLTKSYRLKSKPKSDGGGSRGHDVGGHGSTLHRCKNSAPDLYTTSDAGTSGHGDRWPADCQVQTSPLVNAGDNVSPWRRGRSCTDPQRPAGSCRKRSHPNRPPCSNLARHLPWDGHEAGSLTPSSVSLPISIHGGLRLKFPVKLEKARLPTQDSPATPVPGWGLMRARGVEGVGVQGESCNHLGMRRAHSEGKLPGQRVGVAPLAAGQGPSAGKCSLPVPVDDLMMLTGGLEGGKANSSSNTTKRMKEEPRGTIWGSPGGWGSSAGGEQMGHRADVATKHIGDNSHAIAQPGKVGGMSGSQISHGCREWNTPTCSEAAEDLGAVVECNGSGEQQAVMQLLVETTETVDRNDSGTGAPCESRGAVQADREDGAMQVERGGVAVESDREGGAMVADREDGVVEAEEEGGGMKADGEVGAIQPDMDGGVVVVDGDGDGGVAQPAIEGGAKEEDEDGVAVQPDIEGGGMELDGDSGTQQADGEGGAVELDREGDEVQAERVGVAVEADMDGGAVDGEAVNREVSQDLLDGGGQGEPGACPLGRGDVANDGGTCEGTVEAPEAMATFTAACKEEEVVDLETGMCKEGILKGCGLPGDDIAAAVMQGDLDQEQLSDKEDVLQRDDCQPGTPSAAAHESVVPPPDGVEFLGGSSEVDVLHESHAGDVTRSGSEATVAEERLEPGLQDVCEGGHDVKGEDSGAQDHSLLGECLKTPVANSGDAFKQSGVVFFQDAGTEVVPTECPAEASYLCNVNETTAMQVGKGDQSNATTYAGMAEQEGREGTQGSEGYVGAAALGGVPGHEKENVDYRDSGDVAVGGNQELGPGLQEDGGAVVSSKGDKVTSSHEEQPSRMSGRSGGDKVDGRLSPTGPLEQELTLSTDETARGQTIRSRTAARPPPAVDQATRSCTKRRVTNSDDITSMERLEIGQCIAYVMVVNKSHRMLHGKVTYREELPDGSYKYVLETIYGREPLGVELFPWPGMKRKGAFYQITEEEWSCPKEGVAYKELRERCRLSNTPSARESGGAPRRLSSPRTGGTAGGKLKGGKKQRTNSLELDPVTAINSRGAAKLSSTPAPTKGGTVPGRGKKRPAPTSAPPCAGGASGSNLVAEQRVVGAGATGKRLKFEGTPEAVGVASQKKKKAGGRLGTPPLPPRRNEKARSLKQSTPISTSSLRDKLDSKGPGRSSSPEGIQVKSKLVSEMTDKKLKKIIRQLGTPIDTIHRRMWEVEKIKAFSEAETESGEFPSGTKKAIRRGPGNARRSETPAPPSSSSPVPQSAPPVALDPSSSKGGQASQEGPQIRTEGDVVPKEDPISPSELPAPSGTAERQKSVDLAVKLEPQQEVNMAGKGASLIDPLAPLSGPPEVLQDPVADIELKELTVQHVQEVGGKVQDADKGQDVGGEEKHETKIEGTDDCSMAVAPSQKPSLSGEDLKRIQYKILASLQHLYANVLETYRPAEKMDDRPPTSLALPNFPKSIGILHDTKHFCKDFGDPLLFRAPPMAADQDHGASSGDSRLQNKREDQVRLLCRAVLPAMKDTYIRLKGVSDHGSLPPKKAGSDVHMCTPSEVLTVSRSMDKDTVANLASKLFRDIYMLFSVWRVEEVHGLEGNVVGDVPEGTLITVVGSFLNRSKEADRLKYSCSGGMEAWEVECVCGTRDDDGEKMIMCDVCQKWMHVRCVHASEEQEDFVCLTCGRKNNNKKKMAAQYVLR